MYLAGTTFYNGGGCILDNSSELDVSVASRVNLLESFYYVADWQTSNLHRFKRFLLDSGAFTALYGAGMSADELPRYVDDYIAYIVENDVRDFFEMDLDAIVGYKRVLEFRREIETQTGRRCIPVWHLERGKDEFLKMCDEYDYVAIGGIATQAGRNKLNPYLRWFTREAHKRGARIHGLGYTEQRRLNEVGFDSVDSTAWLYGNRGGFVYTFDGRRIGKATPPKGKKLNAKEAARNNFMRWVEFAEMMEENDPEW